MRTTRSLRNNLNDLDSTTWLKFQKSWFIHNPPPRSKDVIQHPAKFPETLAQEFIEFFTKKGQVVFDPMVGTGSSMVAALRAMRHSYGIELNPLYADIAREVITIERKKLTNKVHKLTSTVITGNAAEINKHARDYHFPPIDYVITSPPYWNILRMTGSETQKTRRADPSLDVYYSDHPEDLGNIEDYNQFLDSLVNIYKSMQSHLRSRAYITIIVKNIKKGGKIYPLAWDLGKRLDGIYRLKDERIWCQDNLRLAPYGLGNAWVSNIFHHYCLQFQNQP